MMRQFAFLSVVSSVTLTTLGCSEMNSGDMKHTSDGAAMDQVSEGADVVDTASTDTSGETAGGDDVVVPPPQDPCAVPTAVDLDDSANVVEVNLEAAPVKWDPGTGVLVDAFAYNGMIPGPLIRAKVGDTIKVHFTNSLPEETTIHWHGLRVPSAMDGVVHDGTKPIPPGGKFEYEFVVGDPGFFWYHPHLNTASQVERGLYAPFLVEEVDGPEVSCSLPLVLDDIRLKSNGELVPAEETAGDGRLGNRLLSNGTTSPLLKLRPGSQVVLHLVNAANARYFDLALRDGTSPMPMTVVATDGGPITPQEVTNLVLAPGDRYSVYLDTSKAATNALSFETRPFELHEEGGMMDGPPDPLAGSTETVITLGLTGEAVVESKPQFEERALESIEAPTSVAHAWVVEDAMDHSGGGMTMTGSIDGETWPNVPVLTFAHDTPIRLTITNKGYMHHPFHIHGQRFQVIDVNGAAPEVIGWEDTVDLPPKGKLTLLSRMDNLGMWMYHCHILEHAESGMMAELHVE